MCLISSLMSNTFISVVLCPCVMSYLLILVIQFLLPWYYPYCSTLCTLPNIILSSIGTLLILKCGLLYVSNIYVINLYSLYYWIRYSIREYTSTYISNINELSVSIFGIMFSESLFFMTFFWLLFQFIYSILYSVEGIYISDTNELTFTNTFLLSNSGLSLGYGLII